MGFWLLRSKSQGMVIIRLVWAGFRLLAVIRFNNFVVSPILLLFRNACFQKSPKSFFAAFSTGKSESAWFRNESLISKPKVKVLLIDEVFSRPDVYVKSTNVSTAFYTFRSSRSAHCLCYDHLNARMRFVSSKVTGMSFRSFWVINR